MTADIRCEAINLWSGPCRKLASGQYARGCEHEHIRIGPLCAEHANDPVSGQCRECRKQGHRCRILIEPAVMS